MEGDDDKRDQQNACQAEKAEEEMKQARCCIRETQDVLKPGEEQDERNEFC